MVYGIKNLGDSMKILAFLSPMMLIDSISCGILNGLGKQSVLLKYSLSDSVLRILLIVTLLPFTGEKALIWVIAASNLFTFLLTSVRARQEIGGRVQLEKNGLCVLFALLTYFIVKNIYEGVVNAVSVTALVQGIGLAVAIYFFAVCLSGAVSKDDSRCLVDRLKTK